MKKLLQDYFGTFRLFDDTIGRIWRTKIASATPSERTAAASKETWKGKVAPSVRQATRNILISPTYTTTLIEAAKMRRIVWKTSPKQDQGSLMHGGASFADNETPALGAPALSAGTSSSVDPLAEVKAIDATQREAAPIAILALSKS
ncbi:hypothetical protein FS837_002488 [Tulasnella sp. UAMH 9824]|nr:hypothetical protein FS837_002488 [Tulasnella sp. UAMH 9824]